MACFRRREMKPILFGENEKRIFPRRSMTKSDARQTLFDVIDHSAALRRQQLSDRDHGLDPGSIACSLFISIVSENAAM